MEFGARGTRQRRVTADSGGVHTLLSGLLDLVAPRLCPGCDAPSGGAISPDFCAVCAPLLEHLGPRASPLVGAAALAYGGPLVTAITKFKYRGRTDLLAALAPALVQVTRELAAQVDVVSAVPLHALRLRERGYNQSALLAREVSRALGLSFLPWLLVRTRHTQQQAKYEPLARAQNVRRAFHGSRRAAAMRVLLIDDVCTTGATLAACRDALLEAGASDIKTAVLALAA